MVFNSFGVKKINELVVTSNKLTNNFVVLNIRDLGPDMVRGPPVLLRFLSVSIDITFRRRPKKAVYFVMSIIRIQFILAKFNLFKFNSV
jgi:hypothetical protein